VPIRAASSADAGAAARRETDRANATSLIASPGPIGGRAAQINTFPTA
jgi:hypothetical protein